MYTLDINMEKEKKRCLIGYGTAAIFCFVFQMVYEHFSHGVTSYFMVYAFVVPLIGGIISLFSFYNKNVKSNHLFRQLLCGSIIWLTLGSIFQGVLEIYGTSNRLIILYIIVGVVQLTLAFAAKMIANRD